MIRNAPDYIALAERIMADCGFDHLQTKKAVLEHFCGAGNLLLWSNGEARPRFTKYDIRERLERIVKNRERCRNEAWSSICRANEDRLAIDRAIRQAKAKLKEVKV